VEAVRRGGGGPAEFRHNWNGPDGNMNIPPKTRGRNPFHTLLAGALAIVVGVYAGLFYVAEAMSERDYSGIGDPQLRVGYCMVSNTFNSDKYLLAESAVRSPDLKMFSIVMPHALAGVITDQKRAALLALREREELRTRAVRLSFRLAEHCGYEKVAWPAGTLPLDISVKWLQHDSTYLFFLEKIKAEPDAADRVYDALRRARPA
jgi:hypothetical protein